MGDGSGISPEVTPLTPPTTEVTGGVISSSTTPQGRTNPLSHAVSSVRSLFGSPHEPSQELGMQPLGIPVSEARPSLAINPATPAPEPTPTVFNPQQAEQPASAAAPEPAFPAPAPEPGPAASPAPAAEDPMAPTASYALRAVNQETPGNPGPSGSSFT